MFENILNFLKKLGKNENKETNGSKNKAKERLHLVLMQDRANVSADFLELMKQEIIDVIKKYIEVEENEIDVRLTNEVKEDGTTGAPSLYANIPIVNIRNDMKKEVQEEKKINNEKKAESSDNNMKEKKETKEDNEQNKPEKKQAILEEKKCQEKDKGVDKDSSNENNDSDSKK